MAHAVSSVGRISGRRRAARERLSADDAAARFTNLPPGLYDVTSALLDNRALRVSSRHVAIEGGSYESHESAGLGPYSATLALESGGWTLDAVTAQAEGDPGLNIPIGIEVDLIDRVEGLRLQHCRLWFSRWEDEECETKFVDLDLASHPIVRRLLEQ